MKIIPAIDIIGGKCVRLSKGDYDTQKIYSENPLEVAKKFEESGLKFLHLVDLDGAKAKHIVNHKTLENIASNTNLTIDFGGGIKTKNDVKLAFDCGAKKITIGSIAVQNPPFCIELLQEFGSERLILGADCLDRKIKTSGWQNDSGLDVLKFINGYEEKGITQVICTDISKDGMLQGPSTKLYEEILNKTSVQLMASGGISCIDDVVKMQQIGCEGTIIGKAFYEGKITLSDIQKFLADA